MQLIDTWTPVSFSITEELLENVLWNCVHQYHFIGPFHSMMGKALTF